jgi:DNA uptake protein ComE-like DNA-binding protein
VNKHCLNQRTCNSPVIAEVLDVFFSLLVDEDEFRLQQDNRLDQAIRHKNRRSRDAMQVSAYQKEDRDSRRHRQQNERRLQRTTQGVSAMSDEADKPAVATAQRTSSEKTVSGSVSSEKTAGTQTSSSIVTV